MAQVTILPKPQNAGRIWGALARQPEPSVEDLAREVEVLRGKINSLKLAHDRIDREARKLSDALMKMQQKFSS